MQYNRTMKMKKFGEGTTKILSFLIVMTFLKLYDLPIVHSYNNSQDRTGRQSLQRKSLPIVPLRTSTSLPSPFKSISRRNFAFSTGSITGFFVSSAMSTCSSSATCMSPTTKANSFRHIQWIPPVQAMTNDPKTGIALPDIGEIERSIPKSWSMDIEVDSNDDDNPFQDAEDLKTAFSRLDTKDDAIFYNEPRFVEHVDENAVQIMTDYISNEIRILHKDATNNGEEKTVSVLDLCSSWTSHIQKQEDENNVNVFGLGMNAKELQANKALTEWKVQDLNTNPNLPYKDNSFDMVVCQLSIDYLTRPLDVLKDVSRVLKIGGKVHILFSNRLFLSKAIGLWTGADDLDHAYYVGCYLRYCNGSDAAGRIFGNIIAKDLSTRKGREQRIVGDPMYVVVAEKKK